MGIFLGLEFSPPTSQSSEKWSEIKAKVTRFNLFGGYIWKRKDLKHRYCGGKNFFQ